MNWADAATIGGHPTQELEPMLGSEPVVITVCCICGEMRSVLWLTEDRWYCRSCKHVGDNRPHMFPLA